MRQLLSKAVLIFLFPVLAYGKADAQAQTDRGIWPSLKRTWHSTVSGAESAVKATGSAVQSASHSVVGIFSPSEPKPAKKLPLELSVVCSPSPLFLKQAPRLTVLVKVFNSGKRTQLLEFSSSQRADAVLRNSSGQIVGRASADSSVYADAGLVTVNPGERLEYALSLPTSGMAAGKVYTLECALVGQQGLVSKIQITPR
jgi:hypothetical protein